VKTFAEDQTKISPEIKTRGQYGLPNDDGRGWERVNARNLGKTKCTNPSWEKVNAREFQKNVHLQLQSTVLAFLGRLKK
jgi:hypothetical protein